MLVFSQWRPEIGGDGCRVPRWVPVERFAPYVARSAGPRLLPPPPQIEDEESCPSPPSGGGAGGAGAGVEGACGWCGCSWAAGGAARLAAHVARAHARPHDDGLFYCGWRGCSRPHKGFNARYKMLVHVRTHTNERPHTCNQCQKSFSRAENLKIHLRSHSGEKPYVCPYEGCGKAYSNSSDRFKHTRTHTVDKPYCCKVLGCNKRYTDPSSLRKHVKTYKHFTPKELPKQDSSDDAKSLDSFRHSTDKYHIEPLSPIIYSPSRTISPSYNHIPMPTLPQVEYKTDQLSYMPLEPYLRIPPPEMSYTEYSQMYEHAYRTYYSNYAYPARPVSEKPYCCEPRIEDVAVTTERNVPVEDMPLNLKCERRMEEPLELVRHADMPLDLSIRIDVESI